MNGNLSQQQVSSSPTTNKIGAMPLKPKFDGPPPIKEHIQKGVDQPNINVHIPKPGFY